MCGNSASHYRVPNATASLHDFPCIAVVPKTLSAPAVRHARVVQETTGALAAPIARASLDTAKNAAPIPR